jgi:hypothetical protein
MISTGFQYAAAIFSDQLTVGPVTLAKRAFLFCYNQPAIYQIARIGTGGKAEWITTDLTTAISFQIIDKCQGIRVRAYDPTNPPLINIILFETGDPDFIFNPILNTATLAGGLITINPVPVT